MQPWMDFGGLLERNSARRLNGGERGWSPPDTESFVFVYQLEITNNTAALHPSLRVYIACQ